MRYVTASVEQTDRRMDTRMHITTTITLQRMCRGLIIHCVHVLRVGGRGKLSGIPPPTKSDLTTVGACGFTLTNDRTEQLHHKLVIVFLVAQFEVWTSIRIHESIDTDYNNTMA